MNRLSRAFIACTCLLPLALPAATYQCDNHVITDKPSEFTGCVNVETREEYDGGDDSDNPGMDRFASVRGMMNEFGDFSEASDSFRVEQRAPLKIRLMPTIHIDHQESVKRDAVRRAGLYGIYRSFAHTPIDELTVTVLPKDTSGRRHPRYRETITIDRERALHIVQRHLQVSTLRELVTKREVGGIPSRNEWIQPFADIYYNSSASPSLRQFFVELQH